MPPAGPVDKSTDGEHALLLFAIMMMKSQDTHFLLQFGPIPLRVKNMLAGYDHLIVLL